ncbi:hypothetical protein ACE8FZ_29345, partial [Peribacillus frigoritolerans]
DRMTLDLATDTLKKLKKNKNFKKAKDALIHSDQGVHYTSPIFKKAKDALIHSDQGVHYTSPIFQKAVKKLGLRPSMSRRGNCW